MGKFNHLWNHRLDGDDKQARSFLRVVIVTLTLLVAFFLLKKDNIIRWIQAGHTISEQQERIRQLEESNSRMEQRIEDLKNNRDSLETYARETYNFARDNEDIYIVE